MARRDDAHSWRIGRRSGKRRSSLGDSRSGAAADNDSVAAPRSRTHRCAELNAATEGFAEARVIGKGGFGSVYVVNAIPSLTALAPRRAANGCAKAAPGEDSRPCLAVKRAESTTLRELQDVRNDVCGSLAPLLREPYAHHAVPHCSAAVVSLSTLRAWRAPMRST